MFSKNIPAKLALGLILASSVAMPLVASAYTTPNLWPTGFWGPLISCTGNYLSQNGDGSIPGSTANAPAPCTNLCDLIGTIVNIIYFAISIAIFIIAPISLIVGGIMVMIAGANPEMLGTGKKVLTSAVIGIVIVLCSYLIVNTALVAFGITSIGGFNGNSSVCTPPAGSNNPQAPYGPNSD